jgi:Lysyl oxidase
MRGLALLGASTLLAVVLGVVGAALTAGGGNASDYTHLYPDLRTVVPTHVDLVDKQQREILRFSNGIANTGLGPWAIRAEHELGSTDQTTTAIQEIRTTNDPYECGTQPKQVTECYEIVFEQEASEFEYHPEHHHWHTAAAAGFEIRQGAVDGPIVASASKVGFCLIELYRLEGNSHTSERTFWDCNGTHQGIGSGWVDQYHQSTDGQQLDVTDAENGTYYLVSTADPESRFLETDEDNNTAWVSFELTGKKTGNRKATVTGHSDCDSPGLCGIGAPNRG